jgi:hypothetical protein
MVVSERVGEREGELGVDFASFFLPRRVKAKAPPALFASLSCDTHVPHKGISSFDP